MGKLSLYVVDTETTNLSTKGDIVEISFLRLEDGEQRTWYLKAINEEEISEEALEVNGHKLEDITWKTKAGKEKYRLPEEVLPEIENWIYSDKRSKLDRVMVGHNIGFDYDHMFALWNKNSAEETFPFGMNTIDTKVLSLFFDWIQDDNSRRYNLGSIVKRLKIVKRKFHAAEGDVLMTADLVKYMYDFFSKLIDKSEKSLPLFGEEVEEEQESADDQEIDDNQEADEPLECEPFEEDDD